MAHIPTAKNLHQKWAIMGGPNVTNVTIIPHVCHIQAPFFPLNCQYC